MTMPASEDPGPGTAVAGVGAALFFLLAPGTVVGWVPWWLTGWRAEPPLLGLETVRVAGAILLAAGLAGLVECFVRFVTRGRGTPAPALAPRHLVVSGLYRYVRNPMYACVVAMILGQALLLGSRTLLRYGAVVWVTFHLFVRLYEEPTLRERFGEEYRAYCAAVRRWVPRLTPYGEERGAAGRRPAAD
jgi:protein-S-isoprenylcysteine O-methyltransferase Ste14